jgi:hypothetical protein
MTHSELFDKCLTAASAILDAEKRIYPEGEGVVAVDISAEGGTTDTSFQRSGSSAQEKSYNLPSALSSIIEQGYLTAAPPAALTTSEQSFIGGLLSLIPQALPYLETLSSNAGIDPTTFTGSTTLAQTAGRNPFSTDWENQTEGLYERIFDIARAQAATGPDNVRGGQARAGFEMADTNTQASLNRFQQVKGQQMQESGVVGEAIQTANAIEQARRGSAMQAQGQTMAGESSRRQAGNMGSEALTRLRTNALGQNAMGAEFMSRPKVTTMDDLTGKGNQSTFNWGAGAGLNCCFIFMAVHGGALPWWVRYLRNHLGTDETRRGYRRMARWLVPWMERWGVVRVLVDVAMTYPITRYGGYLVREPGFEDGFVFRPVKRFWFYVWNKLGKE